MSYIDLNVKASRTKEEWDEYWTKIWERYDDEYVTTRASIIGKAIQRVEVPAAIAELARQKE